MFLKEVIMPQYLKIADEIILKIKSSKGFSDDPICNINLIIKEKKVCLLKKKYI